MKKFGVWLMASAMTLVMLASCGKSFNAADYVGATLDLVTRHDVKGYQKMTGKSEQDSEKLYNKSLKPLFSELDALKESGMDDETCEAYKKFSLEILKKTKYEVEKSERKDGLY